MLMWNSFLQDSFFHSAVTWVGLIHQQIKERISMTLLLVLGFLQKTLGPFFQVDDTLLSF